MKHIALSRRITCVAMALVLLLATSASGLFHVETNAAEVREWKLVTDAADLAVGDTIIIAAAGSSYAIGTTATANNRPHAAITKNGNTIDEPNSDVQLITLEAGTTTGTFAFNVGNSYLYAASSSSNHLKTKAELDDDGSWTISITEAGIATIKAQGSHTRNWLRYNGTSDLFSCYSNSQADICIYKLYITTTDDSIDNDGTYISFNKTVVPDDMLYFRYYPVLGEGIEATEIGMQYWDHNPDLSDETDAPITITEMGTDSKLNRDYFSTGGLKPHEMMDVQYVRLYVTVGETTYYTPVVAFGLEAYKTALENAGGNSTALALVDAAIAYGTAAKAYFDGVNG